MERNQKNIAQQVDELICQQKENWPLAGTNYAGLQEVESRDFFFDGFHIIAQFNPGRIRSSAARTDAISIEKRRCFLCEANRPKEQVGVKFMDKYQILVNPYPIFPRHLTIALNEHRVQEIAPFFADMLELCRQLPDFTIFYNGPRCGASAPDHSHFQAGSKNAMPTDIEIFSILPTIGELLVQDEETRIFAIGGDYLRKLILLTSNSPEKLNTYFQQILKILRERGQEDEPMLNILSNFEDGSWRIIIFPRDKQRPEQFYMKGKKQILISPAAVELGGLAILPRREDFEKFTSSDLHDIYWQVTISDKGFDWLKGRIQGKPKL